MADGRGPPAVVAGPHADGGRRSVIGDGGAARCAALARTSRRAVSEVPGFASRHPLIYGAGAAGDGAETGWKGPSRELPRATGPKPAGRGQVGNSEGRRRPAHDPGGFLLATRERRAPIADRARGTVAARAGRSGGRPAGRVLSVHADGRVTASFLHDQPVPDGCGFHEYLELEGYTGPEKRGRHAPVRSEEHTSELQSRPYLVCRL